jgi:DegV family protein with EDD domain
MKIALTAESTVDLPKELLARYDIATVPFALILGDKAEWDGEVKGEDLFAFVEKTGTLPHTSAVNQAQFLEFFKKQLADHDAVIHFSLSGDFSSAYQNAVVAAAAFPGRVTVIDSRSLSTGIALLCLYAHKLIASGKSPEEIALLVKARIPFDQASFGLESVDYLYKGGRCSALAALGANLLKIRPQILVSEGKMKSGKKFHGPMMKWVSDYIDATLKEFDNPDKEEVFLTYSSAPDEVVALGKKKLEKVGFKTIHVTRSGGTISCHCGPHCLGILYLNDGPHPIE